jgi:hypothetical protein
MLFRVATIQIACNRHHTQTYDEFAEVQTPNDFLKIGYARVIFDFYGPQEVIKVYHFLILCVFLKLCILFCF